MPDEPRIIRRELTGVEPNAGARRFYERLGYETLFLTMRRRRRTR